MNAYLLLADPAFIEESVRSYYPIVGRIVASYDRSGLSWSGHPVQTSECIERVRRIDTEHKVEFVSGDFSSPDRPAEECETTQRNVALKLASSDADWVIQLDADEVLPDTDCFVSAIAEAERRGFTALDFPQRWFFTEPPPGVFIERATALFRTASGFPGCAAVRADQTLVVCRRVGGEAARPLPELFRVDIRHRSADPARKTGEWPVHRVVRPEQAILHFSWVRTPAQVSERLKYHGHAKGITPSFLADWNKANVTPLRFVAGKALHPHGPHYRMCRLPFSRMLAPSIDEPV